MNPLPLEASVRAFRSVDAANATGLRCARFRSGADTLHTGSPLLSLRPNDGAGSTQYGSVHVSTVFRWSSVLVWSRPTNEESSRMPHDARTTGENGTGALCTTSITESITADPLLVAPQYTLKSAARVTVPRIASRSRWGKLFTVL